LFYIIQRNPRIFKQIDRFFRKKAAGIRFRRRQALGSDRENNVKKCRIIPPFFELEKRFSVFLLFRA